MTPDSSPPTTEKPDSLSGFTSREMTCYDPGDFWERQDGISLPWWMWLWIVAILLLGLYAIVDFVVDLALH